MFGVCRRTRGRSRLGKLAGRPFAARRRVCAITLLLVAVSLVSFTETADAQSDNDDPATASVIEQLRAVRSAPLSAAAQSASGVAETGGDVTALAGVADLSPAALSTSADTVGDAFWSRGDIIFAGVSLSSSTMFVALSTLLFSTPGTTPWRVGTTGIIWELDTNGDRVADYEVFYVAPNGVPLLVVTRPNSTVQICSGSATYDSANGSYFGTFAPSCIGNPARTWWLAYMAFEDLGITSEDIVPNAGWAGPSVRDSPLPLPSGPPIGNIDAASAGLGTIHVAGWTIDPDSASPIAAHVYVDGAVVSAVNADRQRGDIATAFPGYGASDRKSVVEGTTGGERAVCVYG